MNIHYTIHKVADLLGISADAIRLYERENHTVKSNMTALHDHTKDMQKINQYRTGKQQIRYGGKETWDYLERKTVRRRDSLYF